MAGLAVAGGGRMETAGEGVDSWMACSRHSEIVLTGRVDFVITVAK